MKLDPSIMISPRAARFACRVKTVGALAPFTQYLVASLSFFTRLVSPLASPRRTLLPHKNPCPFGTVH
jgi:hypothetical protein